MKRRTKCIYASLVTVFLALLLSGLHGVSVLAAEPALTDPASPEDVPSVSVYLTVATGNGALALAQEEILVRDADGDGALTFQDVLLCAHDARFEGGAAAGYAADPAEDGLSVTRLWGVETDGCGCYINHISANGLLAPVQQGDLLCAVVSAGAGEGEALYCYFDAAQASVAGEKTLTLTLTALGSDAEGAPAALPVADAVIQIDGRDTAFSTDGEGKVTLQFDGSGTCIVSARKDGVSLIPPVCAVEVSAEEPAAGDRGILRWIGLSAAAILGLTRAIRRRVRRVDPL